jgi:hypothetical protein
MLYQDKDIWKQRHPAAAIVFDNELPRVRESRFKKVDWTDIYDDVVEAIPPNMPTSMVQQSNNILILANAALEITVRIMLLVISLKLKIPQL